jgi:hypothetical protein
MVGGAPDRVLNILLIANVVLLLLLNVVVLCRATVATQSLVESSVRLIASFEGAVTGNKSLWRWLLREGLFCAES